MEKKHCNSKNLSSRIVGSILKIAGLKKRKAPTQTPPLGQANGKEKPLSLDTLPVEILLMVLDRLDVVYQVCLQSTNRYFCQLIKIDRIALDRDRCRTWAITCCFEKDMKKYPAKVACAFCKTVRKKKFFRDVQERNICSMIEGRQLHLRHRFGSEPVWGMMSYPPMARWCIAHNRDRFSSLAALHEKSVGEFRLDPSPLPRWTKLQVLRCWHCARCIPDTDLSETGCLQCRCDFCPRLEDVHYFRAGPCGPGEGQYRYDFVRRYKTLPHIPNDGPNRKERRLVAEIGSKSSPFSYNTQP